MLRALQKAVWLCVKYIIKASQVRHTDHRTACAQEAEPPSPLGDLEAHLIYEESHAEAALKSSETLEQEHAQHAMELQVTCRANSVGELGECILTCTNRRALQRLLREEQEQSAALVDSAIEGVASSYGEIYQDEDWPGAGRWAPPESSVRTDVYEWPVAVGSDFGSLDLALGRRRR